MPVSPTLSINRLGIRLRGRQILRAVSVTVGRGERIALLGQSGSGKSMTARAALGLLPPQSEITGRVEVDGTDVTHAPALSRPAELRPAMVMQDTQAALNPLVTISHQLEQPLRRNGLRAAQARAKCHDLLAEVGLPDPQRIARRRSPELSGGQRQRVCVAIAVAAEASVIIADEPTSSLDVVTQAQILRLLRDVTEAPDGPGLLLITHDLHAAAHLCDRALVLEAGHIVEEAPMRRMVSDPQHPHTKSLIASAAKCGIDCERLYA